MVAYGHIVCVCVCVCVCVKCICNVLVYVSCVVVCSVCVGSHMCKYVTIGRSEELAIPVWVYTSVGVYQCGCGHLVEPPIPVCVVTVEPSYTSVGVVTVEPSYTSVGVVTVEPSYTSVGVVTVEPSYTSVGVVSL